MPSRIQRKRTKGWRKPEGAIVVSRPSKWGNPYSVVMMRSRLDELAEAGLDVSDLDPQTMAVDAFESDLRYGPDSRWWWYGPHMQMIRINGDLGVLRGHDLACWCPVEDEHGNCVPCHADVLLELANRQGDDD